MNDIISVNNNIHLYEVVESHISSVTQSSIAIQFIPDPISDESFVEPTEVIQQTDAEWSHTVEPIPEFQFDASSNRIQVNIDVNNTLLSDPLLHHMISRTNAYVAKLVSQNRPATRNSRVASFCPIDYEELLMFFGVMSVTSTSKISREA